jgi:hypothetical protein
MPDKEGMIVCRFYLVLIISFGFYQNLGASDSQEIISDKYMSGPFLIYDCQHRHWVCVSQENFTNCKSSRTEDSLKVDTYTHSCSPIGFFLTKESCHQRKLFLSTHNHGQRFCIKEEWRSKNTSF